MVLYKKEAKKDKRTNKSLIKKFDILLITAALAIAFLLMAAYRGNGQSVLEAQISVEGKPYKSVLLTNSHTETIIIPTDPTVTLKVANGGIAFADALCHDRSCEKCGVLSSSGSIAVCLPAKVVVTVSSKKAPHSGFDAVSY